MGITFKKGFTLLIAVIFTSVILALGLALSSLAYKQLVLSSFALQSQYAFYAADSALECALYADQQQDLFDYSTYDKNNPPLLTCDGTNANTTVLTSCFNTTGCSGELEIEEELPIDLNTHCADVTFYKPSGAGLNYIIAQGYSTSCAVVQSPGAARFVARGLEAHY